MVNANRVDVRMKNLNAQSSLYPSWTHNPCLLTDANMRHLEIACEYVHAIRLQLELLGPILTVSCTGPSAPSRRHRL